MRIIMAPIKYSSVRDKDAVALYENIMQITLPEPEDGTEKLAGWEKLPLTDKEYFDNINILDAPTLVREL